MVDPGEGFELAGAMDRAVARENLLYECGAGSRQPYDEHGQFGIASQAPFAFEEVHRIRLDQPFENPGVFAGIVGERFTLERVALSEVIECEIDGFVGIEDVAQREMAMHGIVRGQLGVSKELSYVENETGRWPPHGDVVVGSAAGGLDRKELGEMPHGQPESALLPQGQRQADLRIDVVGIDVDGLLDLMQGLRRSTELTVDQREVDTRPGVAGTQVERLHKMVDGPLRLSHSMQHRAQVPVQNGAVRQDGQGSLIQLCGIGEELCGEEHVSELYRGCDVVGLQRERVAVGPGRFLPAAEPGTGITQLDVRVTFGHQCER